MHASTFIFPTEPFDAAFHRLDQAVAETAQAIPGYLGEESQTAPPHRAHRARRGLKSS